MSERLYNPCLMSDDELLATFVGRDALLSDLLRHIAEQPDGAGVQHVMLVGARGMGKTTLLRVLDVRVRTDELGPTWQPVRFPEESYGIGDVADFWLACLSNLAACTQDADLAQAPSHLRSRYCETGLLAQAALTELKDWRRRHGKRLLLLVDNLDMILEQIGSELDDARFRRELMTGGDLMVVGGGTSYLDEARSHDRPLYGFFRLIRLERLRHEDVLGLLRKHAERDGANEALLSLDRAPGRVRALEQFTAGNPRLVLMLYRVLARSDTLDVSRGLEELLDQATPYYKAKTESLPPQPRRILEHIARIAAATQEGVQPGAIAEATRLSPAAVSSQLKRLADLGHVRAAQIRGRRAWYTLSEPLYAVWHQMRGGIDARERVHWLVDFLRTWFDDSELTTRIEQHMARQRSCLESGDVAGAREAFEHCRFLSRAIQNREVRPDAGFRMGLDSERDREQALTDLDSVVAECRAAYDPDRDPQLARALLLKGLTLGELGKREEAVALYDEVIGRYGDRTEPELMTWVALARLSKCVTLGELGRWREAVASVCAAMDGGAIVADAISVGTTVLASAARSGLHAEVRAAIKEHGLEDRLLPLARALDYLATGDDTNVAKLSPEVRGTTRTVIAELSAARQG